MAHPGLVKAFRQNSQLILVLGESGVGKTHAIEQAQHEVNLKKTHVCHFSPDDPCDIKQFGAALYSKPLGMQGYHVVIVVDNCDHLPQTSKTMLETWMKSRKNTNHVSNFEFLPHHSVILVSDVVFDPFVYRIKKSLIEQTDIVTLALPPHFAKFEFLRKRMPYISQLEADKIASNCDQYHSLLLMVDTLEQSRKFDAKPSSSAAPVLISDEVLRGMNATERARFTAQNNKRLQASNQQQFQVAKRQKAQIETSINLPDKAFKRDNLFKAIFEIQSNERFRHLAKLKTNIVEDESRYILDEFFVHDQQKMVEILHFQLPMNLPIYKHAHEESEKEEIKQSCTDCLLICNQLDQLSECIDLFSTRDLCQPEEESIAEMFVELGIATILKPTKASYSNETFHAKNFLTVENNAKLKDCRDAFDERNQYMSCPMEFLESMWTSYHCDDGKSRNLFDWEMFPKGFQGWDEAHRGEHNKTFVSLVCPPFKDTSKPPDASSLASSAVYDRHAAATKRKLKNLTSAKRL